MRPYGRNVLFTTTLLLLSAALADAPPAFVSLEQSGGAWWFKSPEGARFLSLGVNHVEPAYWQSPSNAAFVASAYGPDLVAADGAICEGSPAADKWARRVATNLTAWGFNTLGFHNPLSKSLQSASAAYYVVQLDIPVPWGWNMSRSTLLKAFRRRPTDVFGDAFLRALEDNAADVVKRYADDPRVLGYAYTDGPPWTVDDDPGTAALSPAERTLHPWVLALMSLPAEAKGKQAWLACMKARYADAPQAGATYACAAADWPALAAKTDWAALADSHKAAADSRAFLAALMRQWYDARKQAVRRYDAHHLILGDKLNMNRDARHPDELCASLAAMKPFVDVINLQYYGVFEKQRDTLALLYRESQKPILNGDTTCRPMWRDDPDYSSAYYRELGDEFASSLTNLFALPYVVGWHHCGYMRGLRKPYLEAVKHNDRKAAEGFEARRNTYREGFITEQETPIAPLLEPLTRALHACDAAHRAVRNAP